MIHFYLHGNEFIIHSRDIILVGEASVLFEPSLPDTFVLSDTSDMNQLVRSHGLPRFLDAYRNAFAFERLHENYGG